MRACKVPRAFLECFYKKLSEYLPTKHAITPIKRIFRLPVNMKFQYPTPRRDESVVDNYHGHEITDPYRWLEDPDAEETKEFVEAQNKISFPFLEKSKYHSKLKKRLTELWDYPKYSCPFKEGNRYFYYMNTGLQNQSVLYVQDSLEGEASVFLDPNKLSEDGTISLSGTAFSENGEYFAYGLSQSGSDWITIKFIRVENGEDFPEVLMLVKFSSMAWTHDHKGMFYNRYPSQDGKTDGTEVSSNLHQKLYYHRLGTDQSEDVLCLEFPDNPKWMPGCEISNCGRYAILAIREGCDPVNRLYYCDLENLSDGGIQGILPYVKVVDNFDAEYEYITNEGTVFTFKTNLNSPRYKLINIDFAKPEMENWVTLIEEDEHDVLEWASCINHNKLVLCYLHDVKSVLHVHDLNTGNRLTTFSLDVGSVVGYSGKKKNPEIFYLFTSFLIPGTIFYCDMSTDKPEPKVFREIKMPGFDASQFETKQIFFTSKDSTRIPMFIVHKKGLELDGSNPALLYGYGGFNISITPYFSVSRIIFIQNIAGILAVANIRGGGEYGETWHKSGMLSKKQNVFDDFQAAAEYLIENKYTSSNRLTINGGSNGGLLVGACCNQRPDLFGCVVVQVGVLDMFRFHKFTIGHCWTTDFGCSAKQEEFEWLLEYSPLHNIRVPKDENVQYPAVLLLTGDHDDRVVPLHSLKFIAELQHIMGSESRQTSPLLIRVDTKSGHGAGKPTAKIIEEMVDIYSFIMECQHLEWSD